VIGVADYKDLMEKIPNKIKNLLGTSACTKRYEIAERTARNDLNELVDK